MNFIKSIIVLLFFSLSTNAQEYDSLFYVKLVEQVNTGGEKLALKLKFHYGIYGRDRFEVNRELDGPKLKCIVKFLLDCRQCQVKIGVHSDCLGRDQYNKSVTERKATLLWEEIHYVNGTDDFNSIRDRLQVKGYGESNPIANCNCKDCNEDQHKKNNRIDIEVSKTSIDSTIELHSVKINNESLEEIIIDIEVNEYGDVVKAEIDKIKTTITDEELFTKAISIAYEYKFEPSLLKKQTGEIVVKIKPEEKKE